MLKIPFLFTLCFFATHLFAQAPARINNTGVALDSINKVYEMFDVETPPTFVGGDKALFSYLGRNMSYPTFAREKSIQGTVILTFIVNETGKISDAKIIQDVKGGCGQEALRLINTMPDWIPGTYKGKNVKIRYTMPVRFKLE